MLCDRSITKTNDRPTAGAEPKSDNCAVGPVGAKAHTPEEYLELDSIVPRAQALALAILRLGQG